MAKVQKRRAVSMSPEVYKALCAHAQATGRSAAGLAEMWLRQALCLPASEPRAAYRRVVVPTYSRMVRRDA